MIKVNTSILMTGMTLAKPIYDNQGKLLIDKGMKLSKNYINKLLQYKIDNIYINWNKEDVSEVTEVIIAGTKSQALSLIKETVNNINIAEQIDIKELEAVITDIIENLISDKGILLNLTEIRNIDDYTFGHSVNVCILSLIMGIALNYDKKALMTLGLGALLHDIGKVYVNNTILNKPSALSSREYEEIQRHSMIGYEIFMKINGAREEIGWIIRDHHERYDGTGYPNGIRGKNIHIFPRIVAICDVYDALTANRVYRNGIPSYQAVEYLMSMGNHKFDYDLVKVLLKNLCIYPIGTLVKLQSGDQGIVVDTHKCYPTRPIVEIVRDSNNQPMKAKIKIDLSKSLNNGIVSIVKAV